MLAITAAGALCWAVLHQVPVVPASAASEGVPATASADGTAFYLAGTDPFSQQWERGTGSARVTVRDRVQAPGASFGDEATLSAHFRLGLHEYGFTLTQAGFPPTLGRGVRRPPYALGGGVVLDRDVFGSTGLGARLTQAHAAFALWGLGTVTRDGQVLSEHAVLEVMALSAGTHADDDTFVMLRQARPGDTELLVLATQLPSSAEPRGFLEVGFDDVRLTLNGHELPAEGFIANSGEAGPLLTGTGGLGGMGGGSGNGSGTTSSVYGSTTLANLNNSPTPATSAAVSAPDQTGFGSVTTATGPTAVETGIPATPRVANDGSEPAPLQQAPAPANAQTGTALVPQISPANSQAAGGSAPLETNITPLNSTPATPLPSTPGTATTPAPAPLVSGTSLPPGISPLNSLPATPLPGNIPAAPLPAR